MPVSKELTYANSGVDRKLRAKAKFSLKSLEQTYQYGAYGKAVRLPYGNIIPFGDRYLDLAVEGVGTKVLLSQLADKYDTIGVDGVAMAVNDVIRSGAKPLAIVDNLHTQVSDPILIRELMKGLVEGATHSNCMITGGEIGDVGEIITGLKKGKGFDMVVACIGEVDEGNVIWGNQIKPGDIVIGLRSSGLHSNGISLARKVLFKAWGGLFDPYDIPDGLDREIIHEVMEPTKLYVKQLIEVMKFHQVKGAVHITGDAYVKFDRLMKTSQGIGFNFTNIKPQPIFEVIQESAKRLGGISTKEMLKTFNLGWGFALIVDRSYEDNVLDILGKTGIEAEKIGNITSNPKIIALYQGKKIVLR
jgi:phosphoribosylformylglycinamidine cyclo-ligase